MKYIYERTINYYETDKMGVVHHSNYLRFLEEARCQFLLENNLPYTTFEESNIMIPVLAANLVYKTPVTFADIISIEVELIHYTGVQFAARYTVTNKNTGSLVITGETKHCFISNNFKPVNIRKTVPEIHEQFNKLLSTN